MKFVKSLFRRREVVVLLLLLVLVAAVSLVNPSFARPANLAGIATSALILILLGVGESFVIITKGIDVSVGAVMGIAAVVLGLAANKGASVPVVCVLAVATGLVAGGLNGLGVAVFNVPPIIMTLGTMGVLRGLMPLLTGGSWIDAVPQSVKGLAAARFLGLDAIVWAVLAVVLITSAILKWSRPCRYIYPVGDNEEGAFLLGIPVKRTKFLAYVVAGGFAGLAAILFVSQLSFVPMQAGSGQEMRAVAASVLGGVSLAGGVGGPFGPLVGGLFLTAIDSILVFLKLPAYWNDAVAGGILLAVVLFDYYIRTTMETENKKARMIGRNSGGRAMSQSPTQPAAQPSVAKGTGEAR
jgi:AI-2 transport system permease protein